MKIGEYEQMMSYLTRPDTKTETRENFKYGTVPGEGNSRIEYDPEIDTYRKRVQETVDGKKTNKYIFSESGQSLGDFKKIKPVRSTGADDATVKARQYVDGWTKNWFDNNLKNYGVKDFDVVMDDLSSAWQLELESGNVPKGKGSFNLSTPKLNLPNITTSSDAKIKPNLTPFQYNDVTFYTNLEGTDSLKNKTLAQFKKVFYKDQINTNPQLREGLNKFFDFMSLNKQGQYKKLGGKTIKDFMNTEVSDEVKFLLNPEISGLDKASKKEVFNSYSDFANNYNKYTEDKVRLKAVQSETEAVAKAGKKTADQYKKVKADIAKQNDVLAKMSIKDIANNKQLLNSVRLSINPQTGEVSYTNYTVNDPKGKPALTDLELAEKIKQKAKNKNFYVTEHIGKKSFNKANLAFPNNIQSANYMSNAQLENARRFLIIPENRNTAAAQILDKTLENLKLTIRGPEYGGKPIGNKMNIVFDSKTGVSNIVQEQTILQNIQGYSKLPQCRIDKAEGGRIGFAYSDECIRDGLKEQKIEAQRGNKKAAQELVQVGKVATRAGLLKNLLGPGAILGEAVYEGAVMGNKILGGTPKDIAWAESYLSYLDPRKYTPEGLDPLKMRREDMITREDFNDPDYAEGESKTVDGPNANILRSGFAAQDDITAFNKAVSEKARGEKAGRLDISNEAAANIQDMRRTGRVSAAQDIISSDAFQDATKQAQEYIANQEAQNRFNLGIFGTPQGELSDDRRRYKANKAMLEKFPMYTPEVIDSMYKEANIEKPENLDIDIFNNIMRDQDKMNYFADNFRLEKASGGIASLTKTIPPESGPTPQGLPYVYNNVKKI